MILFNIFCCFFVVLISTHLIFSLSDKYLSLFWFWSDIYDIVRDNFSQSFLHQILYLFIFDILLIWFSYLSCLSFVINVSYFVYYLYVLFYLRLIFVILWIFLTLFFIIRLILFIFLRENLLDFVFDPKFVYTFDFYQHRMNLATFKVIIVIL